MISRTTWHFRKAFAQLPSQLQEQARQAYRLFQQNPQHTSLRYRQIHPTLPIYSARVGIHYRAVVIGQNMHKLMLLLFLSALFMVANKAEAKGQPNQISTPPVKKSEADRWLQNQLQNAKYINIWCNDVGSYLMGPTADNNIRIHDRKLMDSLIQTLRCSGSLTADPKFPDQQYDFTDDTPVVDILFCLKSGNHEDLTLWLYKDHGHFWLRHGVNCRASVNRQSLLHFEHQFGMMMAHVRPGITTFEIIEQPGS